MAKIEISAGSRNAGGKGAARKVRNAGNIPAVIYGGKTAPAAIELKGKEFEELVKKPGLRTKLFVITIGKDKEHAMLADIQYHPVKDNPTHVDFKRVDVANPVVVNVPLNLLNRESSRGLKMGGALNFATRSVTLIAKVDDIPEKIDVDLTDLGIMDTVHGRDLKIPDGVKLGLHQADLAFLTITGKMKEEVEVAKPAAATAAAAPTDAKDAAAAPKEADKKPEAKKDDKK
ncbi:MAG: 50S ribosomal protein L25/general stress protein Ctc [Rickettsiales bacterium]|jgi:large subunit ribosomal protein L25|nr:50S ribosomal protein L25/general stress protein Ctc [Rickettsiales bacterium]